jgi:UDP-2,3-diacylglucosamine pyrophosphatase LpxH
MDEYTIISDLHLGSDVCRADNILEFLYYLETENLILNGDIFDNMDFRRLKKCHWHILKKLRQISKHTNIIWISGNHDFQCEPIAHLIGAEWKLYHIIKQNDKTIYVTHGDIFDKIITKRPILTKFADNIYRFIQLFDKRMDNNYYYSGMLKRHSKTLTRITDNTVSTAIKFANKNKYDSIIIGHLHKPSIINSLENMSEYVNSGSWTEENCTYLTINNSNINLKTFITQGVFTHGSHLSKQKL